MSDLISRRKALTAIADLYVLEMTGERESTFNDIFEAIKALPSEPERKTGRWIDESVVTGTTIGGTTIIRQYRCSECGNLFGRVDDKFCGKCGARMEADHET